MTTDSRKICLCTVTSEEFIPGTRVLIRSFLDHNRWFNGDIVIITDGITADQKSCLSLFPRVTFQAPGENLLLRIGLLCQAIPEILPKRKRFYSLEAFKLCGYDRVFFFDSDMLVTGEMSELLSFPGSLLACSDQMGRFAGRVRDKLTFKRIIPAVGMDEADLLRKTFNAGFMVLEKSILGNSGYNELVDLVHPGIFSQIKTHNTDQVVFNLYFNGKASMLSTRYNLIVSKWSEIKRSEGLALSDLKVLHFTGNYKPWNKDPKLHLHDSDPEVSGFFNAWHSYDDQCF